MNATVGEKENGAAETVENTLREFRYFLKLPVELWDGQSLTRVYCERCPARGGKGMKTYANSPLGAPRSGSFYSPQESLILTSTVVTN